MHLESSFAFPEHRCGLCRLRRSLASTWRREGLKSHRSVPGAASAVLSSPFRDGRSTSRWYIATEYSSIGAIEPTSPVLDLRRAYASAGKALGGGEIRRSRSERPRAAGKSVRRSPAGDARRQSTAIRAGNRPDGGQVGPPAPATPRAAGNRRKRGREDLPQSAAAVLGTREDLPRIARGVLGAREVLPRIARAVLGTRQSSPQLAVAAGGTRQDLPRIAAALNGGVARGESRTTIARGPAQYDRITRIFVLVPQGPFDQLDAAATGMEQPDLAGGHATA